MRRLGSGLVVALVMVLVAASYPVPVAVGSMQPAGGNTSRAATTTADAVMPTRTVAVSQATPASPTSEDDSTEEAARLLARLKPSVEQAAAKSREPAVELPKRLRIPAISVDTGFEYVGLAADGAMDVPKDPSQVAWYRLGPRPGERGNAVVAGHVDWGGKLAVFWGLSRLKAGDVVEVTAADDRKYEFSVQWVRWYDAAQASVDEVFGQGENPELTLITCGGDFDRKTRQYLSRVVVRAVLR